MKRAALGFRAHSGWAAVVAIAGSQRTPEVIYRGRVDLVDREIKGSGQPYHIARKLDLSRAEKFIREAINATQKMARSGLTKIIGELSANGHTAVACGIVLASGRPLPPLEATLRSHAMVHTAEGEMFRAAIAYAGEKCGLRVSGVRERDALEHSSVALHIPASKLKHRLNEMGKSVGSPWTSDEKNATLVAWLALARR